MKAARSDGLGRLLGLAVGIVTISCNNEEIDRRASTASVSPVQVVLRGTTIQRIPQWVDIIAKDPESYLQEFIAQTGARIVGEIPNTVRYCDVVIHFARPEEYPDQQVGDAIYMFLLPARKEVQKIICEHNLSGPTILEDAYGFQYARYGADLNHYVIFQIPVAVQYRCQDHPDVVLEDLKECPICGHELQYYGETYGYYLPEQ